MFRNVMNKKDFPPMKEFKANKKNTFPDDLLAEMPIAPQTDFVDRVLGRLTKRPDALEKAMKSMPVEPASTFIEKTLDAIETDQRQLRSRVPALRFVHRFSAVAATIAVCFGVYFFSPLRATNEFSATQLANRINQSVQNDPELYALTQTEEPSFDELLEASKILVSINPSTLEIFAYND